MIIMKKGKFRENIKLSVCFVLANFYSVRLSLIKSGFLNKNVIPSSNAVQNQYNICKRIKSTHKLIFPGCETTIATKG